MVHAVLVDFAYPGFYLGTSFLGEDGKMEVHPK